MADARMANALVANASDFVPIPNAVNAGRPRQGREKERENRVAFIAHYYRGEKVVAAEPAAAAE